MNDRFDLFNLPPVTAFCFEENIILFRFQTNMILQLCEVVDQIASRGILMSSSMIFDINYEAPDKKDWDINHHHLSEFDAEQNISSMIECANNLNLDSFENTLRKERSQQVRNTVEPFTIAEIASCVDEELLRLPCDEDLTIFLGIDGLSLLHFIRSKVYHGCSPDEVILDVDCGDRYYSVTLTKKIWKNILMRGERFSSLFTTFLLDCTFHLYKRDRSLLELQSNKSLWERVKLFHYDLMSFEHNQDSQVRLESEPLAPYFMTSSYFDESEREYLLDFPTSCGLSCRDFLEIMTQIKLGTQGENATLCSSHDMAPAIAQIFSIRKGYAVEKTFMKFLKEFNKGRGKGDRKR
eukprot:gene2506-4871_t